MVNNVILPKLLKPRRKVFVSYQHSLDQNYANEFRQFYGFNDTLIDRSLPERIDSENNDYILGHIRTNHLKDSTVTIVLIGKNTWSRKWVDWEIYSSLRPYKDRTVNGLLGILLPNASKFPPRFGANYKVKDGLQVGYAILLEWAKIAPPPVWRIMADSPLIKPVIEQKQAVLKEYIEYAFSRRSRADLIDNTLLRFKNNKPVPFSVW